MLKRIVDAVEGKAPLEAKRSNKWPAVRASFLVKFPKCSVCGGKELLEVHHQIPFHIEPALELAETNLITLCENKKRGINCHLLVGHLGDYKKFNIKVVEDADYLNLLLKDRKLE